MIDLTARQQTVLLAVALWHEQHGYPPSFKDIAVLSKIKYVGGVVIYLRQLRSKGLLTWEAKRARTMRLTDRGKQVVGGPRGFDGG